MVLHKISFSLLLLTVITTSVVSFGLSYLGNYEEGQNCGTNSEENGYFGKCLKIKDCKSEFNEYKNNQRGLQVCSYSANKNSEEDLICCSKDDLEKSILDEPWMKVGRSLEYNECVFRYLDYREIYGCNSIGSTSSATEHSAVYQDNFDDQNMRLGIRQQFCAKVSVIDGIKKDTCFGDIGSGIQNKKNFTYGKTTYKIPSLVGIVSFGVSCGQGYPTVFTKIGNYIHWMESVIFAE
ncbi:unnamed protein product [Diamesa tonsa]